MKPTLTILLIFFCCFFVVFSQDFFDNKRESSPQFQIIYSMEYDLPFWMKLIKKWMPQKTVLYTAKNSTRMEVEMSAMGSKNNVIYIENYDQMQHYLQNTTIKNDSVVDYTFEKKKIEIDSISTILFRNEKKTILGYPCKSFIIDNDSSTIRGFLSPDIPCPGILITGQDYGLPMEYQEVDKNQKVTIFFKITDFIEESFDSTRFTLSDK